MALEPASELEVMVSDPTDVGAGETKRLLSIAGGGDRTDADIHSQVIGGGKRFCFGDIDGLQEEPVLAIAFELRLTYGVLKQVLALLADLEVELDPGGEGAQGETILFGVEHHHPLVKGDSEIGLELNLGEFSTLVWWAGSVVLIDLSDQGLIGVTDLGDGTNNELGGELKESFDVIVGQVVQIVW